LTIPTRLRIALTADPELPVPPLLYGGIERIIDMLARGLLARGHEVTLFANAESTVPCAVIPYGGSDSQSRADTLRNMSTISRAVARGGFDVVHSFGRIAYLLPLLPRSIPKLMTYQRDVTPRSVAWGHRLSRGTLHFSAISQWMTANVRHLGHWHLVYNGVPTSAYEATNTVAPDAPLVFLGRIEHIKGTHLAIEVARRTGRRLVIAGNIPSGHQSYFDEQVRPHIDGDQVSYVGPVDDQQKNRLLGGAAAMLMPILWEEPFGIVMAEAMACGAPVIGLNRGAVPEVVEHGVTGFVEETVEGLASAVGRLSTIDRKACRARVEQHFSERSTVEGYLSVYRDLMAGRRGQ
jgi:glycosyltransferase involved in cell wall biosynthesis